MPGFPILAKLSRTCSVIVIGLATVQTSPRARADPLPGPAPWTSVAVGNALEHYRYLPLKALSEWPGQFPDGALGIVKEIALAHRVHPSDIDAFENPQDAFLHQTVCGWGAIVVARAGTSLSTLTPSKNAVLTRTVMSITDVLSNKIGLVADKPIEVVRVGGDVMDNGKLLRLQNLGALPYWPGRFYLLLIHTGLRESETDFYPADGGNVEVRDGKVQFDAGAWEGFRSGVSYEELKGRLLQVKDRSC